MAYDLAMKIFCVSRDLCDGDVDFDSAAEKEQEYWRLAEMYSCKQKVQEMLARFSKNNFAE